MSALSEFLPYVLPYVAGCSTPLAEMHLRRICIDFCTYTSVVQATLDPMDAVQGQIQYDIDTPQGMETAFILDAHLNGHMLPILNGIGTTAFAGELPPGIPTALQQLVGNEMVLDRAPYITMPAAITLHVSLKPTRNTNNVADVLFNDYAVPIGYGVVAHLMMMPGHRFSNPGMAQIYENNYQRERTEARIRANKGFAQASSRVTPRRFI